MITKLKRVEAIITDGDGVAVQFSKNGEFIQIQIVTGHSGETQNINVKQTELYEAIQFVTEYETNNLR